MTRVICPGGKGLGGTCFTKFKHVNHIYMQRTVPQSLDLGPSFDLRTDT